MIVALGLGVDPTMRYFVDAAAEQGAAVRLIDLAALVEGRWELRLPPDGEAWVDDGQGATPLDPHDAYYCRLIDLSAADPTRRADWSALLSGLESWLELAPGTVVNRPGHMHDNGSKPLHEARLARLGLSVAPSVTASARAHLLAFLDGGPAVAKAICGMRADCRVVTAADFDDYDERSGPVHLQRVVDGDDLRAHVIGDEVVCTRVRSDEADYRLDPDAAFAPCELPAELRERLCAATRACGLAFAGWDLREDGERHWVFEANPMPGYHYYDRELGGTITTALLAHLTSVPREAARA
jgi:hypothetical protein